MTKFYCSLFISNQNNIPLSECSRPPAPPKNTYPPQQTSWTVTSPSYSAPNNRSNKAFTQSFPPLNRSPNPSKSKGTTSMHKFMYHFECLFRPLTTESISALMGSVGPGRNAQVWRIRLMGSGSGMSLEGTWNWPKSLSKQSITPSIKSQEHRPMQKKNKSKFFSHK